MNNIGNTRIKKFISIVAAVSVLTASSAGAAEIGEGISENAAYFKIAEISENAAPSENSADFEGDPASERDPGAVTGEDGIYEDGSECQSEGGGYIPMAWDDNVTVLDDDITYREGKEAITGNNENNIPVLRSTYSHTDSLPEQYPAAYNNEAGLSAHLNSKITPTRDQAPYGTCWAHTSMALGEMYQIAHAGKGRDINYSEMQLSDHIYRRVVNPVVGDEAQGGSITFYQGDKNILTFGGNVYLAAQALSKGIGFADESKDGYKYNETNGSAAINGTLNTEAFSDDVAHLKNTFCFNIKNNPGLVKQAIRENGIAGISYCDDNDYYDPAYNSYYCPSARTANHAVAIVGWDDNYPSSRFRNNPGGNGAWLVRNSWNVSESATFNHQCYFWLSYYDKSLKNTAFVFELNDTSEEYDFNYYYDVQMHTNGAYGRNDLETTYKTANVFTANGDPGTAKELLVEVQIETLDSYVGGEYSLDIYTDLQSSDPPEKGESKSHMEGNLVFPGIYTIELEDPVELDRGERFSVVLTTEYMTPAYETKGKASDGSSQVDWTVSIQDGQSYMFGNGAWHDLKEIQYKDDDNNIRRHDYNSEKGNFCIAAHTLDAGSVLKASDFNITLPNSSVYKGTPYSATVVPKAGVNSGEITIYYGDPSGSWSTTPPTDAGTYRVKIDTAGSEDYNPGKGITDDTWKFTIAKATQKAVTLNGDKEKTYGDPDFTVTASGGNGTGAFVYSSSDEAVLSVGTGGRVTVNGVGTAEITVYRAESKNYRKSGSASIMITVKKADQTLNHKDMTVKYGGGTFELVQPGGQSSGKCVYKTDSKDILVIMDQTGTAVAKKPGRAVVTVYREGDDNYNRSADASFDVNVEKGVITISADDITVLQDKTMPELTYTAEGMAGWDALTREPVLTCEAADTSVPGTYDINASGAEVGKPEYYEDIRYIKGTLTVIEDNNKRYEEVIFKDLSGGGTTLIHDKESNTYRTADGRDVVVVSNEKGEDAGNPAYQYTGKKITPGRNSSVVYNGTIYNYGTDYKASYKKNKKRGTATLTIKWQKTSAPYLEGVKKTIKVFDILPRSVSENMVSLTVRKGKIKKIMVFAEGFDIKATKKDYSCSGSPLEGFTISFKNNFEGTVLMKENYQ